MTPIPTNCRRWFPDPPATARHRVRVFTHGGTGGPPSLAAVTTHPVAQAPAADAGTVTGELPGTVQLGVIREGALPCPAAHQLRTDEE